MPRCLLSAPCRALNEPGTLLAVPSAASFAPNYASVRARGADGPQRGHLACRYGSKSTGNNTDEPLPDSLAWTRSATPSSAPFGVDGSGIKVGVISDSFATMASPVTTMAQDIVNDDLPANTTILQIFQMERMRAARWPRSSTTRRWGPRSRSPPPSVAKPISPTTLSGLEMPARR